MPQPSQSDLDWAKAYGEGGNPTPGYKQEQHKGTEDEARARDAGIIGAALDRADSGKPTPDSTLRRE
jgi:hypothetical protein